MVGCTLVSAMLVSAIDINKVKDMNRADSQELVKLRCATCADDLNELLVSVEQSVELLAQHATAYLGNEGEAEQTRIEHLKEACLTTANFIDNSVTVYFHYDPEHYDSTQDFLYIKDKSKNSYYRAYADNPALYAASGLDASWYYASAQTGEAKWLAPYDGAGIDGYAGVTLSSYTVPVYNNDHMFVGVLGMDFEMDGLIELTKNIKLYETGYAFLTDENGKLIYHPNEDFGIGGSGTELTELLKSGESMDELYRYKENGKGMELCYSVLRNGMRLAVTVPTAEVNAKVKQLMGENYILLAILMTASIMIIFCIVYSYIRPLIDLSEATNRIIEGNMSVKIDYRSRDEIGVLAENFRKMAEFLKEHIAYINKLAFFDAMTGMKNKAAYEMEVTELDKRIQDGTASFGIMVFDLNNLKATNDHLGHSAGDKLIKNAGRIIRGGFVHCQIYRIGGDEFAAVLDNDDLIRKGECIREMQKLNAEINNSLSDEEKVYIAYGFAGYDAKRDKSYSDVFARADRAMYEHKILMKQSDENGESHA